MWKRCIALPLMLAGATAFLSLAAPYQAAAQPDLLVRDLKVRVLVTGLSQPTAIAFLGRRYVFVAEKATGKVQKFLNGTLTTVLDLSVNSASERGLLGMALHPDFPTNKGVYLFWT